MIREFSDSGRPAITESVSASSVMDMAEADERGAQPSMSADSLMVEIEGIHAYPHHTRNFTRYMPKCLKESVPSWTKPYRRPLIKHHNEANGEIIGRICGVEYENSRTLSGTPALLFTVNVPGSLQSNVKNGLWETASIGIIAHDVRCSICGKQLSSLRNPAEEHEHKRGEIYLNEKTGEQETCFWDIYSMEGKELSYVVVPSDIYAKNVRTYPATESGGSQRSLHEGYDDNLPSKGDTQMPKDNMEGKDLAKGLEEKVDSLEAKIKELEEAKNASEKSCNELEEAKSSLEAKVKEFEESTASLEAKVKELGEAKASLEAQEAESKELKESLESELSDLQNAYREAIVDRMQSMREALGKKALDEEAVKSRTNDSIRDSIADMKEEFSARVLSVAESKEESRKPDLPSLDSVQNPAVVPDTSESGTKVTESATSRIDLKAGLENLIGSAMRGRF